MLDKIAGELKLKDPSLLEGRAYINGQWRDSDAKFKVVNPATGAVVAEVTDTTVADVQEAIDAAYVAQKEWAQRTGKERAAVLRKWFDLMMEAQDDLGTILCAEMGKPLAEAKGEVAYGASFIEWFAEEAKRIYGDLIPAPTANKRLMTVCLKKKLPMARYFVVPLRKG